MKTQSIVQVPTLFHSLTNMDLMIRMEMDFHQDGYIQKINLNQLMEHLS